MVFKRARKLIIGVDPGLNCALAILSLEGIPILLESRREWPLEKIIERIREFGEPTIVSSDVSPAPSLLEELSRKFNAILFEPAISLSSDEKQKLAKIYSERYGISPQNAHEIDALAAAVKAYHYYKSKFEQADAKLKELGCNIPSELVKDLVAKGYRITSAIKLLAEKNSEREQVLTGKPDGEERLKETIKRLVEKLMLERERNRLLRETNRMLNMRIRELEEEVESLKAALKRARSDEAAKIRREREYQRLLEEVRVLRSRLAEQEAQVESYRRMLEHLQRVGDASIRDGMVLLKPIEAFTREGLEKAFKLYDIRFGDIVFILDPSGGGPATAKSLIMRGIKAAVVRGRMSHQALEVFEEYSVPIISAEKVNIVWIEGLPYANQEEVKRLIKDLEERKTVDSIETLRSIMNEHLRDVSRG